MMRGIAAGMLLWASACFAVGLGVGVFGGAALPTGKMGTAGITPYDGSNMSWSPKFGAKAIISLWRGLEAEAAVAYHLGHGVKGWQENDFVGEPASTLVPVTVGANYRFDFGKHGLYAGAGGGYYFEKFKGGIWWHYGYQEFIYYATDVSLNGPGLYAGGGVTYAFADSRSTSAPATTSFLPPRTLIGRGGGGPTPAGGFISRPWA